METRSLNRTETTSPEFNLERYLQLELIGAIELSEERGSVRATTGLIKNRGHIFASCDDPAIIARFERAKRKLEMAEEFERIHGSGTLLRRDHPLNVQLLEVGILEPSDFKSSNGASETFWARQRLGLRVLTAGQPN